MSTYLIDYENVKSAGLAGINHIRKEDSVHLFWSSRENKISIEMMELIRASESEIVMHKAFTGEKDALDHQLCSYFGYLAGAEGELDFVIVSNDRAYDRLIEFWGMMKPEIRIRRVTEIARVSEADETSEVFSEIEDTSIDGTGEGRSNRNARRRGSRYLRGGKNNFSRKNRNPELSSSEQETDTAGSGEEQKNDDVEKNGIKTTESTESPVSSDTFSLVPETGENTAFQNELDQEEMKAEEVISSAELQTEKTVKTERTGRRNRNRKQAAHKANAALSVSAQENTESVAAEADEKYAEPIGQSAAVTEQPEEYIVEKTTVKPVSSFVLNVISGIKTGIVVESGFTADGILDGKYDSRKASVKEIVSNESTEAEPVKADDAAVEETEAEPVEVKEAAEEVKAEPAEVKEAAAEAEAEPVEAEEAAAEAEAEPVKAEEAEAEPVKADDVAAEETTEEVEAEPVEDKEAEEAEAEPVKADDVAAEETTEEVEAEPVEAKEAAEEATEEDEAEELTKETTEEAEAVKSEQKPVKKKAARRGRPPKKTKPVNTQEKKAVVSLQDVIANCEEAEKADWAPELVNRINSAGDKKELYAATVKLLGQEKGRTIYHMIKGLK